VATVNDDGELRMLPKDGVWRSPGEAQQGFHISLYMAPWCGVCRRARAWLDSRGYVYETLDVEARADAATASSHATHAAPSPPSTSKVGC